MSTCSSFSIRRFIKVLLTIRIQLAIFITRFLAFFHSSFLFLKCLFVSTSARRSSLFFVERILAFAVLFALLDG